MLHLREKRARMKKTPHTPWSVAIFAHNEADNIIRCLTSCLAQSKTTDFPINVLANGCKDSTEKLVEDFAKFHPSISLFKIDVPDKANAWNHYTHKVAPERGCHFFVDGDVVVAPNAFRELYDSLIKSSEAVAAGGLPASGRSCDAWSDRMVRTGRLAGCFYALHGDFLADLREQGIRIPVGLIGEDFYVTCLAKGEISLNGINCSTPRVVFNPKALFTFDSFSPRNPKHWWVYLNRLIRYQVREYQLFMLFFLMESKSLKEIPADVQTLYGQVGRLPKYRWRGRMTPIDMIAVWKIRHATGKLI